MSVPEAVRAQVREDAGDRCGYCLSRQRYVLGPLEIEHLVPKALGGTDDRSNLWLSCRLCNQYKATQVRAADPVTRRSVRLYNPRRQRWSRHFAWSQDGTRIVGLTPTGRATVAALRINNPHAEAIRREWVMAGWHPPKDVP